MNRKTTIVAALSVTIALLSCAKSALQKKVIVSTDAYRWVGDTIFQSEFKAWADNPGAIRTDYRGRPGYFMPVAQQWNRRNDLSAYPILDEPNKLLQAVYNMGLDEMVNAVEPDTTLRTGKEWAGVWTRDVSYSIILSMAQLQPEASKISLRRKINSDRQIIQDTGSGGAWPVSTDRMVWTLAAWEIYKTTGDCQWLREIYPVVVKSLAKDKSTVIDSLGLVKGETSFIDWREQSYPRWMQTADISQSRAMGTNVMYCAALDAASQMAGLLGHKKEQSEFSRRFQEMRDAIDKHFMMPEKGYYAMYDYGRDAPILNPRAETLGMALAILYDIAPEEHQRQMSQNNPITPFGPAIFYPQIPDVGNYHNNALWPFVAAYWTLAQAKVGNEQGVVEGIGSVVRPAALFCTNKENFNLDNGDYFTELNSSNMLWSLSGNLALTQRILFGLTPEPDGLRIAPFVPEVFSATRTLSNYTWRGHKIKITVEGYGDTIESLTLNGKKIDSDRPITDRQLKGENDIRVVMQSRPIPPMTVNHQPNRKTFVIPQTRLIHNPDYMGMLHPVENELHWNPVEYAKEYIVYCDGEEQGRTRQTWWTVVKRGDWQVVAVDGDGIESFASEPLNNRNTVEVAPSSIQTALLSKEVSYPVDVVVGYKGEGFAETDHDRRVVRFEYDVENGTEGPYRAYFIYANGNGPVNTENKCAVRTLYVDGNRIGTIVMPQRGVANWNDWGRTNSYPVELTAGHHVIELRFDADDENMNRLTNHAAISSLVLENFGTPF